LRVQRYNFKAFSKQINENVCAAAKKVDTERRGKRQNTEINLVGAIIVCYFAEEQFKDTLIEIYNI
jgi:hypothetical protein